ncbi:unnamed protein product, partial [marine sediment metagenome]
NFTGENEKLFKIIETLEIEKIALEEKLAAAKAQGPGPTAGRPAEEDEALKWQRRFTNFTNVNAISPHSRAADGIAALVRW